MGNRVVITGIGPVTALGIGRRQLSQGLLDCRNVAREIPAGFAERYDFKSRFYVPFPQFDCSAFDIPGCFDRMLQSEDRAAILGTKLALEDAGYEVKRAKRSFTVPDCRNACTVIGIGLSSLENALDSYLAHLGVHHPQKGAGRYQKMIIPMMMPNSVAAWVTIFFGLTGGSHTVNASCASGTAAIGDAFRRVRSGLNPVAVTGGVEALLDSDGATMRGFDTLGTLTRATDGRPRPFSEDRSGFLFAEGGGCILILEELHHALERQAPIYAEILDHADNSDAFNIVQVQNTGQRIEELCRRLSAGQQIDYFNAHGTGTVQSDEIEKTIICRLFGKREHQPAINSTKGLLGHTIGASGAIEAAVTAVAIRNEVVHGNASTKMMPELNLIETTQPLPVEYAITVSYGFGGHNNGLLLKRFEQ